MSQQELIWIQSVYLKHNSCTELGNYTIRYLCCV